MCLLFGRAVPAAAAPLPPDAIEPSVVVTVDGVGIEVPLSGLPSGPFVIEGVELIFPDAIVQLLNVEMDPDPSIFYAIAVIDGGDPSTFEFVFTEPITPTGSPNVVFASLAGRFIDVDGDGYSFTPVGGPLAQVAFVGPPPTNMGVDLGPAFEAVPASPGTAYTYGPFAAGPQPGPGPRPWTEMTVTLRFSPGGGGDTAALTGFVSIEDASSTSVPEPLSLPLFAAGVAGLAALVATRRLRPM